MYLHCNTHKIIIIVLLHNPRINMRYTQRYRQRFTRAQKKINNKKKRNWRKSCGKLDVTILLLSTSTFTHSEQHRYTTYRDRHDSITQYKSNSYTETHSQKERQDILICKRWQEQYNKSCHGSIDVENLLICWNTLRFFNVDYETL